MAIPKANVDRIIRAAIEEREDEVLIGRDATVELKRVLEDVGLELSRIAIEFTINANRKTVKEKDIKSAYINWKKAP